MSKLGENAKKEPAWRSKERLSPADVAKALSITRSMVYVLRDRGRIHSEKDGEGRCWFKTEEIVRFKLEYEPLNHYGHRRPPPETPGNLAQRIYLAMDEHPGATIAELVIATKATPTQIARLAVIRGMTPRELDEHDRREKELLKEERAERERVKEVRRQKFKLIDRGLLLRPSPTG